MTPRQTRESQKELQMRTRRFIRPLGRAVQAAQFFRLGCLIVLAVAVSGMGARADDGQPFSTSGWSAAAGLKAVW